MANGVKLTPAHRMVLEQISKRTPHIEAVSEPYRQKAIDLAMMEPPLVDTDGPRLVLTDAGRSALSTTRREGTDG